MERKRYPTDLSDSQWEALESLLPQPKCGTPKGGRPAVTELREVCDALFHHLANGAAWRMLPHDFPPWQTMYGYFRTWRDTGVWERMHARLREEVRVAAGVPPTPETLRVDKPDGEDHLPRRPGRVRRGEKRRSGGSGSWPLTRWG